MNNRILHIIFLLALGIGLFVSCERWDSTEGVSHVSELPVFEFEGGQYLSFVEGELDTFIDPGVRVTSGGEPLPFDSVGAVNVKRPGLYIIAFYAVNADNLEKIAYRYVAITHADVSSNDFTGKYTTNRWGDVEMKVKRLSENGYYKCSDVLGYPGIEVEGAFVDLGNNNIVLLPGDGFFGRFAQWEGR